METGYRLVRNGQVADEIERRQKKAIEASEVTESEVIARLAAFMRVDVTDAIPDSNRPLELSDLKKLPEDLRRCIRGWKLDDDGIVKEILWHDAHKAAIDLGRTMALFKDKVELESKVDIASIINTASQLGVTLDV